MRDSRNDRFRDGKYRIDFENDDMNEMRRWKTIVEADVTQILPSLMVELDHLLTGRNQKETSLTAARQRAVLDPEALMTTPDGYYLSDGGYSRIRADDSTGELLLSGVSRDQVKGRWNDADVIALRTQIEDELKQVLRDAGVLIETGYADRRNRVAAWLDGLGDPIRLYREVVLPKGAALNMGALGRHWTPDRDKAIAPFGRSDHSTGERAILSCLAPRSAVDADLTISNMLRYGEYEVTLIPGTEVEVDGRGRGTI